MARHEEDGSVEAASPEDPENGKIDEDKDSQGKDDGADKKDFSTVAALKEGREGKDLNPQDKSGNQFDEGRLNQHSSVTRRGDRKDVDRVTQSEPEGQVSRELQGDLALAIWEPPLAQGGAVQKMRAKISNLMRICRTHNHESPEQQQGLWWKCTSI